MRPIRARLALAATALTIIAVVSVGGLTAANASPHHTVTVPKEDRFTPFATTVHVGDTVQWINQDTDDHTVVSDDAFNTAGHQHFNQLLIGTDANHGQAGTLLLRFDHAGTFVYYCRFHATLDDQNQPVAPGPKGGIQDANGNLGTPMMGIVTVVDDNQDNNR